MSLQNDVPDDYATRIIIVILLGVTINVLIVSPSLLSIVNEVRSTGKSPNMQFSPGLSIGYFLVSTSYCIVASLTFKPKRIVSPFLIQAITALIITIFVVGAAVFSGAESSTFLQNLVGFFFITWLFIPMAGAIQLRIVIFLIGWNLKDLNVKSFTINSEYQIIRQILESSTFQETFQLHRTKSANHVMLVSDKSSKDKQVIALTKGFNESEESVLDIVSYQIQNNTLRKTAYATEVSETIAESIHAKLIKRNPKSAMVPTEPRIGSSNIAYSQVLKTTQSPIVGLTVMPRRYVLFLLGLTGIIGTLVYLYDVQVINLEIFVSTVVLVLVTIMLELIPFVKEGKFKKE